MADFYSICVRKKRTSDTILKILLHICSAVSILLLVGIMAYVFYRGARMIDWTFLSTVKSTLKGTYGILGNIVNTVYIIIITLLIVTPIGIGSAVYLNEYAKPGKMVRLIEFTTETLSGIPSIIFGLFGMVFFGNLFHLGYSLLTGALTLSIMILPLITRNTQEALKTVPEGYRNGALGMGAGKWYMIRTILLPQAMPGIITGIILSIGRIVGESAALLFTAGSAYMLPRISSGWLTKILDSGGTMTIELYLNMSKAQYDEAFGIAVILLCIVLCINLLTKRIVRKWTK